MITIEDIKQHCKELSETSLVKCDGMFLSDVEIVNGSNGQVLELFTQPEGLRFPVDTGVMVGNDDETIVVNENFNGISLSPTEVMQVVACAIANRIVSVTYDDELGESVDISTLDYDVRLVEKD